MECLNGLLPGPGDLLLFLSNFSTAYTVRFKCFSVLHTQNALPSLLPIVNTDTMNSSSCPWRPRSLQFISQPSYLQSHRLSDRPLVPDLFRGGFNISYDLLFAICLFLKKCILAFNLLGLEPLYFFTWIIIFFPSNSIRIFLGSSRWVVCTDTALHVRYYSAV